MLEAGKSYITRIPFLITFAEVMIYVKNADIDF